MSELNQAELKDRLIEQLTQELGVLRTNFAYQGLVIEELQKQLDAVPAQDATYGETAAAPHGSQSAYATQSTVTAPTAQPNTDAQPVPDIDVPALPETDYNAQVPTPANSTF